MKKITLQLIMTVLVFQTYAVYANDEMFNKMESQGTFDKIRANFIASCYTNNNFVPTEKIDLASLKNKYPERVNICTCFQDELVKVSNRTIFDDSKHAYQLMKAKAQAMKNKDTAKMQEITEQEQTYQPFMSVIVEKCGLKK